jgi:hypothetical protein
MDKVQKHNSFNVTVLSLVKGQRKATECKSYDVNIVYTRHIFHFYDHKICDKLNFPLISHFYS